MQIESNGPIVPYAAANQRMRDLVVVALRSFLYVITKHGGRLNKDLDHLLALSLHIRHTERADLQQSHVHCTSITSQATAIHQRQCGE